MRASWSGNLRIGDIVAPVKLYTATKNVAPRFIQLHEKDNSPVMRLTVCLQDGEEVAEKDLVRAAEFDGGYVRLSEEEIAQHSGIERNIVVRQFSDAGDISPVYYEKSYYLVPGSGGELAYAILRRGFERTKKVAIVTLLFYGREQLAALSLHDGLLMLQMLRFADEIVPKSSIKVPAIPQPSPRQMSLVTELIERYASKLYVEDYRNAQLDALSELIERKAKGLPIRRTPVISEEVTPPSEVTARMRALLQKAPKVLESNLSKTEEL